MGGFKPRGDRPLWEVVYELLVATPVGGVVTYQQMAKALRMNTETDRHRMQMVMRQAAQRHEKADKRAVDAVPNVGYRIVEAPEHLVLARRHQRRSSKSLQRGYSKSVNVDLSALDPQARHAFEIVAQAFSMQMDFNRRIDVRQKRLEQEVQQIRGKSERTENEIAELRARLEKLEG